MLRGGNESGWKEKIPVPWRFREMSQRSPAPRWFRLATLLVAGVGILQVTSTYTLLSHTVDEPTHIAAGLEWLQEGTYRLQAENPPLARVATAIGPYLAGHRLGPSGQPFRRGVDVLYAGGNYAQNLIRSRLGTLPFFVVAIALVWLWAYRLGGERAAFLAAASFCTLPPILGHAGLAATDLPFAAAFVWVMYAFTRWLESPIRRQSLHLGLALGFALLTKFSTLVFLPPCVLAVLLLRRALPDRQAGSARWRAWASAGGIVVLVSALMVWAAYRFSIGTLAGTPGADQLIERLFARGGSLARQFGEFLSRTPAPPDLLYGLLSLYEHVRVGNPAYLLGQESQRGFWYFYPVALAVKTPLTFAFLSTIGLAMVLRGIREARWQSLVPVVSAASIVLTAMTSTINIGLRHVLVVYPLLAVTLGMGIDTLLRRTSGRRGQVMASLATLVLAGQFFIVLRVHPNYLAYFNPLAGREPGRILVDSDLDWGQDLLQLQAFFKDQEVDLLHVAFFGSAHLCDHGLPPLRWLGPEERVTGWIAISEMYFRDHWRLTYSDACDRGAATRWTKPEAYAWLRDYEPLAFAGRSIRIYHVR